MLQTIVAEIPGGYKLAQSAAASITAKMLDAISKVGQVGSSGLQGQEAETAWGHSSLGLEGD